MIFYKQNFKKTTKNDILEIGGNMKVYTSVSTSELFKELDYEKTLPKNLIDIFLLLKKQVDLTKVIDYYDEYVELVQTMNKININNKIKYSFYQNKKSVSVYSTFEIEEEDISKDWDTYLSIMELYKDKNFNQMFNVEFIKSICKVHKSIKPDFKFQSQNASGLTRDKLEANVNIRYYDTEILTPEYKKIKKYLSEITKLNLVVHSKVDALIAAFIIHAYFEGIHPFMDGNGRVGRYILNNNINMYFEESIYLEKYILKDKKGYYKALYDFCGEEKHLEAFEWYQNLLLDALKNECNESEKFISNFRLLLDQLKRHEKSTINKRYINIARILSSGEFITYKEIKKILAEENLDTRTIKKIINILKEEKRLIEIDDKIYRVL